MPRMEIELTGPRPDGGWGWRAAGARHPRGVVEGSLVPPGAKVGDVMRAETAADLDGITVLAVVPGKTRRDDPAKLVVTGSGDPRIDTEPRLPRRGVAATNPQGPTRAPGARRERTDRDGPRRPGGPGGPGDRDRGRGRGDGSPRSGRLPGDRVSGRPGDGRNNDARGPSTPRGDRPADRRTDRPERRGPRPEGSRSEGDATRRRPEGSRPAKAAKAPAPRPRARRLVPGRARRDAVLTDLAPVQRQIAEQVLRGGIPAVRQAVEEQNTAARAAGAPEIQADALLAMAEDLLPVLRAAEWYDRAEAAIAIVDEVSLRDLRTVVLGAGAEAASRDEGCRALAASLRDALARRQDEERDAWVDDVKSSLTDGRVVRALRVSGRAPQPGMRLADDLTARLAEAAGAAMGSTTTPERWMAVLEAVTTSAVRRRVTPAGLPADPPPELTAAVERARERVPGLAALASGDDRHDAVIVEELRQPVDQT